MVTMEKQRQQPRGNGTANPAGIVTVPVICVRQSGLFTVRGLLAIHRPVLGDRMA